MKILLINHQEETAKLNYFHLRQIKNHLKKKLMIRLIKIKKIILLFNNYNQEMRNLEK